jgi:hypothetical protein
MSSSAGSRARTRRARAVAAKLSAKYIAARDKAARCTSAKALFFCFDSVAALPGLCELR